MKARPRSVENEVAAAISETFERMGLPPVERIPVLGRTGPDITWNDMHLIVDVKSRQGCPKQLFFPLLGPFTFGNGLIGVRLNCLEMLWGDVQWAHLDYTSVIVQNWLDHMDEWTKARHPEGVSAIVLHRPKLPIGSAVFVTYSTNHRRLRDYAEQQYQHSLERAGERQSGALYDANEPDAEL